MASDDANTPTPELPNNDLMIKTLQDLQASIKSDFGNLSEQIQTMDKTLKDVKSTVDQANEKATDALKIANEAQSTANTAIKTINNSEIKMFNFERRIKILETSNEEFTLQSDKLEKRNYCQY